MSADGTAALNSAAFSEDGKYMAYGIARSGSDWVEIFVKEVPTGRVLDDVIRWVKFSGANWSADSKGFYYRGYEEPAKGSELSGQNQFQKVYYHRLGTPQSEDEIIYADPLHPLRYYDGFDDGDTGKY
ncbi:MAG: S9 family peptidase, partial [Alistipes inops]